ncbi:MAG: tetraacyldisaccharide 4'-kinase [Arenicellales bacterium]
MARPFRLAASNLWRGRSPATRLLVPLSWVYLSIIRLRRMCYAHGPCRAVTFAKPVVVVGGITVGGSGKTPLVMHVVRLLAARDRRPGIVSRGYGGRPRWLPLIVDRNTPPSECGDEPAMMAANLDIPVVVDPNRPRGVNELISALGCDIVVSDDGLQHYRMDRQVEIAVVGGAAPFGNGFCLPAGPLREPRSRLKEVDLVVYGGVADREGTKPGAYRMEIRIEGFIHLGGGGRRPAGDFEGRRVHAVAGTGNPDGFFDALRGLGLNVQAHPFPDHHRYRREDFSGLDGAPIVMTEKDAVKCRDMKLEDAWYAATSTHVDTGFDDKLIELLKP